MDLRIRKLLWGVGLLFALPAVSVVALLGFVHTAPGERWLAARIASAVGGAVEGLALSWPLQPRVARLTLADQGGGWLEAHGLAAEWSPLALFGGTFAARSLTADGIDVARLPEGGGGSGPRLPVKIDIAAVSAPIGLGAAVAGQPIALTISGSATADAERLGLDIKFRRTDTPGSGKAVLSYDGDRLALDVAADESLGAVFAVAGLPPLAVTLAGQGPVADWRGTLRATSGGAACLSADLGLAGDRLHAAGTAQPPCLPVPEPVRFALDGTLAEAALTARLESAAYGGSTAQLAVRRDRGDWLVEAKGRAARLPGQDGATEVSVVAGVSPAADVARIAHLGVHTSAGRLVLAGTVGDGGHAAALYGLATIPSLTRYAPSLSGRGFASVAVHGDLIARHIRVAIAGTTAGFASGDARIDRVLGPAPRVNATVALTASAVPAVDATLTGAGATLTLGGAAAPLALGWRLRVAEIEGTRIDATGFATGSLTEPRLTALARLRGPFDAVAAIGSDGLDGGRVHATVKRDKLQAEVTGNFRLGEAPALTDLRITSGADKLAGDLRLRPDGTIAGRLDGDVADLAPWSTLAGIELGGRATIAATLSGAEGRQIVDGKVEARNLSAARLSFDQATLKAEAKGEAVEFRLAGRGATTIDAAGTWRPDALRLASLELTRNRQTARLVEPATLTRVEDGFRLNPVVLDVGRGRIAAVGKLGGEALDLRLDLTRVPVQAAEAFLPGEKFTGTIDGELRLAGTLAAPQGTANLRGRGLGVPGGVKERIDADMSARWRDRVVEIEASARGGRGANAQVEARLPLVLDGTSLRLPDDGAVRGRLAADGDIERLTEALPITRYRFAGNLKADLSLSGTVADPQVDGTATIKNGYYQFYRSGLVVRNIDARLTAEDSKRFHLSAQGVDGREGRVVAEGAVRLDDALIYDVAVDLQRFRIADIDTGTAIASGALELHGIGDRGKLTGQLDVGPAEYNVAEHLPGGKVPHIEVIEINKPGAPTRAATSERDDEDEKGEGELRASFVIDLDVKTRVNRLFVRGRGLESAWSGDLVLGGTDDDPTLAGTLTVDRGTFDFVGRNFQLSDSRVVFDGGTDINPRLDVLAEASAYDITAQVRLTGTADKPQFDFTSTPVYPKDEILAHLLFGKQVGQLSVGQQVQLARAAASLSGAGGGLDPVGGLRKVLGLDLLDVGTDDTSSSDEKDSGINPRVTVGKYLDDNTFVKVEEGGQKGGKVAIERQIGRGLSVEAGVGRRGGGTLGLNWRTDY